MSNACDARPCKNGGTCTLSTLNTYQCTCPLGWTGATCTEKDHCANQPCRNGAQCISLGNNYKCRCREGFKGPSCNININECFEATNPCQHGRCQDMYGGYK